MSLTMNTSHPCACFVVISLGKEKQNTSLFLECIKVTIIMMPLLQKHVKFCSCCFVACVPMCIVCKILNLHSKPDIKYRIEETDLDKLHQGVRAKNFLFVRRSIMLGIPRLQACNAGMIPRTYELAVLIIYIISSTQGVLS